MIFSKNWIINYFFQFDFFQKLTNQLFFNSIFPQKLLIKHFFGSIFFNPSTNLSAPTPYKYQVALQLMSLNWSQIFQSTETELGNPLMDSILCYDLDGTRIRWKFWLKNIICFWFLLDQTKNTETNQFSFQRKGILA